MVFEAADRVGGQVVLAGQVGWRKDLASIIDWRKRMSAFGVTIKCNHFADDAMIKTENPNVVIIATGGVPHTDWLDGDVNILSTWDVLSGMALLKGGC